MLAILRSFSQGTGLTIVLRSGCRYAGALGEILDATDMIVMIDVHYGWGSSRAAIRVDEIAAVLS